MVICHVPVPTVCGLEVISCCPVKRTVRIKYDHQETLQLNELIFQKVNLSDQKIISHEVYLQNGVFKVTN